MSLFSDWFVHFKRYEPLTNDKRERETTKKKKEEKKRKIVERVRADARCVDETTIGMLFIRSGHDWMMKRCSRRRRKMVDDRSFSFSSSSSALSAWQMQMDPSL